MRRVNTINYACVEDAAQGRNPLPEIPPSGQVDVRDIPCPVETPAGGTLPARCPVCGAPFVAVCDAGVS